MDKHEQKSTTTGKGGEIISNHKQIYDIIYNIICAGDLLRSYLRYFCECRNKGKRLHARNKNQNETKRNKTKQTNKQINKHKQANKQTNK